ncbi:hypothetical protein, partial [Mycobacterium avium]|uniref:hypothetical protein n=1 Tax=Mycobacterium avium TaxID=1764 RepID=UPI001F262D6F
WIFHGFTRRTEPSVDAGVHRLAPSVASPSLAPPGAERETRRTFGGERKTNFTLARRSRSPRRSR